MTDKQRERVQSMWATCCANCQDAFENGDETEGKYWEGRMDYIERVANAHCLEQGESNIWDLI